MSEPSRSAARWRAIAAWALAATLLLLAGLKVQDIRPRAMHSAGLVDLLRQPAVVGVAGLIELGLGVALLTRARRFALHAVLAWVAVLAGALFALVILDLPLSSCGCFGSWDARLHVRVSVLCGMGLLALAAGATHGSRDPQP